MDFKVLQWNIRSYHARLPYLNQLIYDQSPSVICLQETHLRPDARLALGGFSQSIARNERVCGGGGGVAVLVKSSVPHTLFQLSSSLEIAATQVYNTGKPLTICSLYLPPSLPLPILQTELSSLLVQLPRPFLICTDANAHHPAWGSVNSDSRGTYIQQWLTENNLHLLNTSEPTYLRHNGTFSCIDLSIASDDIALSISWQAHHDPCTSDHFPLIMSTITNIYHNTIPKWQYDRANWQKFQNSLHLPSTLLSPSQACGAVVSAITSSALAHIPHSSSASYRK